MASTGMLELDKMVERLKKLGSATSQLVVSKSCHDAAEAVSSGIVVWKIMPANTLAPINGCQKAESPRLYQCSGTFLAPTCCTMTCS